MNLEKEFEVYRTAKGDCTARMRQAGYWVWDLKDDEIRTLDDFKKVIGRDGMSKEKLRAEMKKVYKNRISAADLRKFLMSDPNFGSDVSAALQIIPTDEDGSILVDTFVDFLYK